MIARKKRAALYLSICGLLAMVAAVSAVSARDPSGASLRIGMIMVTLGAAMWLNWRVLLPAAVGVWLGTNGIRAFADETSMFGTDMLLELPGLLGVAIFAAVARHSLKTLEDENILLGATSDEHSGVDPETGVHEERLLRTAIETEVARARRFRREFALLLVGIDAMRQRFDYRDEETWEASFVTTARLLRGTRNNIDRAYRYGATSFALILPESSQRDVMGLVRRLRRVARHSTPAEGEAGGPLPTHFGATFYPQCATTTDDLLRRAEIALRIAEKNSSRMQLDSAEAPEMASPETMRRAEEEHELALAGRSEVAVLLADESDSPIDPATGGPDMKRPDLVVPIPLRAANGSNLDNLDADLDDEDDFDADYDEDREAETVTPFYEFYGQDAAETAGEPDAVRETADSETVPAPVAFSGPQSPAEITEGATSDEAAVQVESVTCAEIDEAPMALWDALSPEDRAAFEVESAPEAGAAPELAIEDIKDESIGDAEPEVKPAEAVTAATLESELGTVVAEEEPGAEPMLEAIETEDQPETQVTREPIAWPRLVMALEAPDVSLETEPETGPEAIAWPKSHVLEPVDSSELASTPEAPREVPYLRAVTNDEPETGAPTAEPEQESLEDLLKRMDQTLDLLKTLKSGTGS